MTKGAGYAQYEQAYYQVKRKRERLIPTSGLIKNETITIRDASPETDVFFNPKQGIRQITDLIYAAEGYTFLTCNCGLKLKIPPDALTAPWPCPRCSQPLQAPVAILFQPKPGKEKPQPQVLEYTRRTSGWESFHCIRPSTGLSPMFRVRLICRDCGGTINIRSSSTTTITS